MSAMRKRLLWHICFCGCVRDGLLEWHEAKPMIFAVNDLLIWSSSGRRSASFYGLHSLKWAVLNLGAVTVIVLRTTHRY